MSDLTTKDYYSITFKKLSIKQKDIKIILDGIKQSKKDNILIDMSGVKSCCNNFFRMFEKINKKISLINADSEILATLYMMNFDKYIKIYNEKISYLAKKNELKKNHLVIVNY